VRFADYELPLPPGQDVPAGRLIVGIRPTDFAHAASADPALPRMVVTPEVVEDLGSEAHVIFPIDAPRVVAEAVQAAVQDLGDDEGALFVDDQRSLFTARVEGRCRSVRARLSSWQSTRAACTSSIRRRAPWSVPVAWRRRSLRIKRHVPGPLFDLPLAELRSYRSAAKAPDDLDDFWRSRSRPHESASSSRRWSAIGATRTRTRRDRRDVRRRGR
jgi:Acetyl esterase (deacetylase)